MPGEELTSERYSIAKNDGDIDSDHPLDREDSFASPIQPDPQITASESLDMTTAEVPIDGEFLKEDVERLEWWQELEISLTEWSATPLSGAIVGYGEPIHENVRLKAHQGVRILV